MLKFQNDRSGTISPEIKKNDPGRDADYSGNQGNQGLLVPQSPCEAVELSLSCTAGN